MKTVGEFDQDHPRVIGECKQDLFEVLRLLAGICIHDGADLCEPVYDFTDFCTKLTLYIVEGEIGIFHGVVQQGANGTSHPKTNFFNTYFSYCQWMKDIR